MRHTLIVERATPWPHINPFEGEVEGRLDGHPVRASVYLTLEPWDALERDGEQLRVDSIVPMDVDLDLAPDTSLPDLRVGDRIRVQGRLELDFDPGDYEN